MSADSRYKFETKWFAQKVDHINKQHGGHFWQRYFLYEKFTESELNSDDYPLFVFCGAEQGDIYMEWAHFGFMVEVARKHGAKVLYLEHRFFGQSKPFGKEAFLISPDRVGLLSMEQSMADYVAIIEQYRGNGPVLTFGGSLSGTMAVMMRVQYPTLIDMAFASSAPILGVVGVADQFAWRKRLTQNFAELGGSDCPELVRRGFAAFYNIPQRNNDKLKEVFALCDGPITHDHWDKLIRAAWQELESLGNFPYPEHKSRIPLVCRLMREVPKGEDERIFAKLLNLGPWGGQGVRRPAKCLNLRIAVGPEAVSTRPPDEPRAAVLAGGRGSAAIAARPGGASAAAGSDWIVGWSYMACTEVVHPIGANGVTDFFPAYNWSAQQLTAACQHQWGVTPDFQYLSRKIDLDVERAGAYPVPKQSKAVAGRILFSSGSRDPWGTMVPTRGWAEDVVVVPVPGGGHCSDLATPTPEDSMEMREARGNISAVLGRWIMEIQHVRHMKLQPFGDGEPHGRLRAFGSRGGRSGSVVHAQ